MTDRFVSRGRSAALTLAAGAGLVGVAAPAAQAEIIYVTMREASAMDPQDKLLRIDSANPGVVQDLGFISGLGSFQYLEDIDFRPATGELYGLGYTGSVYKIDLVTLAATAQGFATAPGSGYSHGGIDFNPVTDRLRVVDGSTAWNATYNPVTNTGSLDTDLAYTAGDPNFGSQPDVGGVAYSNNVNGALSTTLYSLDARAGVAPPPGILGTITPPGSGQITTVGGVGMTIDEVGGFDISGATGIAYVILNDFVAGPPSLNVPTLYSVNLATGALTSLGAVNIDTDNYRVTGLSVAPADGPGGGPGNNVPLPMAALAGPAVAAIALAKSRRWRRAR
jgi:hypothetical protein